MSDKVRIEINKSTREAMKGTGKKGDTYDSLIIDMIRVYKMYTEFVDKHKDGSNDAADGA